jgi:hypothetical protein
MSDVGGNLFRTVFEYASLADHHRTGTPEDIVTLDWFESRLAALGAAVERQPWTFDRYAAAGSLAAGGGEIESLPLFYEGAGDVETSHPFIATTETRGGAELSRLEDIRAAARAAGHDAIVVLTAGRGGRLFAVNRRPCEPAGIPALLAGSGAKPLLERGPVSFRMSARLVAGESANIIGRLGPGPDERRLMLTTPLSGWFRCAGERGTGIAVMLAVAEALAAEGVPLLVTGNSGHELEDLGARRYLEAGAPGPRAVFHFGASVAAGEPDGVGGLRLSRALNARVGVPGREQPLRKAFRPLAIKPAFVPTGSHRNPASWVGEARAWCTLGRPLVSIAGGFPLFHTSADIPARATTPALLEASYRAALDVARVLAHADLP